MYKTTDEIFVRINRVGYIPLIGICGPIPNPIKIPTSTCLKLVNAGIEVYQFDPTTKMTVKLTRENVFDDNKFGKKAVVNKLITPVKKETPVIKPVKPMTFTGVPKVEKVEEPVKVETPVVAEPVEEVVETTSENVIEEVKEELVETTEEVAHEEKKEDTSNSTNVVSHKYDKKRNK